MTSLALKTIVTAAGAVLVGAAHAGPYILAGTDADDHGQATATTNQEGWLFMQRALENLASSTGLTTTNRVVVSLGSSAGDALNAAQSAFSKSNLPGAGWTFQSVSDLTVAGALTSALGTAGIIMLDSGGNVSGGLTNAEETVLTNNAAAINSFVGGGGGLFSQAGDYGWLSALVPGLTVIQNSGDDLALTPAGSAAFPGLTNADLSAGPWHNSFGNIGAIPVLATGIGTFANSAVIIGSGAGSITNPENPPPVTAIPEPETYALMLAGLGAIGAYARRRRKSA
jgi:hypothetical protein